VLSPWEPVRKLAAEKLHGRAFEEFVPEMLAAIRLPVRVQFVTFVDRTGGLVSREIFVREGRDQWQVLALDTRFARAEIDQRGDRQIIRRSRNQSHGALNRDTVIARNEIASQQATTEMSTAIENARTEEMTRRITASLATATGQENLTDANDWWNWWTQESELEPTTQKSVAGKRLERDALIVRDEDRPYDYPKQVTTEYNAPPLRLSCFAAGTMVCTISGSTAIEDIRVGDMVLAQDAETGETAFKPIMRTTIRPPVETFTIETSAGKLRSTGGHLFWVAGEGWTKARHLQSGQTLHCAAGTVQVSEVTKSDPAQTYNLVVADFNTYFVGPEKILTHDVTDRKPSKSLVPGLPRE
jgi:hypothetical protein